MIQVFIMHNHEEAPLHNGISYTFSQICFKTFYLYNTNTLYMFICMTSCSFFCFVFFLTIDWTTVFNWFVLIKMREKLNCGQYYGTLQENVYR